MSLQEDSLASAVLDSDLEVQPERDIISHPTIIGSQEEAIIEVMRQNVLDTQPDRPINNPTVISLTSRI